MFVTGGENNRTGWGNLHYDELIAADGLDVVIEATGSPAAGTRHALAAIAKGRHVVMVTADADALAGPLIARRAAAAGVVYSLAYGDQPALISELVDWARATGFKVVCAGKGTKYRTHYHASTPDTIWGHYGMSPEDAAAGGLNPQMFNSFLDGSKSAIEMAAVANACGLTPPKDGLGFPPIGVDHLADRLKPLSHGGLLERPGTVEVVSCEQPDGAAVAGDLRWGVYVTFAAPDDYVRRFVMDDHQGGQAGHAAMLSQYSHRLRAAVSASSTVRLPMRLPVVRWS